MLDFQIYNFCVFFIVKWGEIVYQFHAVPIANVQQSFEVQCVVGKGVGLE